MIRRHRDAGNNQGHEHPLYNASKEETDKGVQ